MSDFEKSLIKTINNHQESVVILDGPTKKEESLIKNSTNIGNVDKFAKVKSALRKSLSLNITPETYNDRTNESRSKILKYMEGDFNKSEGTSQLHNRSNANYMPRKYEKNILENFQTSTKFIKNTEGKTKLQLDIIKPSHIPRQYHSDIVMSDKIPNVGGLRNYYRYMGYADINNTVEVVSELKASFNDGNKSSDS